MPKTYKRSRRIADLIQREISLLLKQEIRDPRLSQIVITDIQVSDDLHFAKMYYTLLDASKCKEVRTALIKATGFLRHELAHKLKLRYVPEIQFQYDESLLRAERIDRLLSQIPSEDSNDTEKK